MTVPIESPQPIAQNVALLSEASSYPEHPRTVEVVETHMSWVFLTDLHVYKLKKPVRYDYLDFSTLAARRHFCEEEVRLNRRLAASVYLDVVPLARTESGVIQVGGQGTVVEWLVKMRRLPAERMLDRALTDGTAGAAEAHAVAVRLGAFHLSLPGAPVTAQAYRQRLHQAIAENEQALCDRAFALPVDEVRALCEAQRAVLNRHSTLFDERVAAGRVVEGHGDLRPEHVCLAPPISIIDCLEFSEQLRTLDAADEAGFLALECERLGRADFARAFLSAYAEATGDTPPAALMRFYQSHRAVVRAKIAVWHLQEAAYRGSPKWNALARRYLQLAGEHIASSASGLKGTST
ncbi:MAG TPA: hypothetical protein VF446_20060 [Trinickia sp.]